jgi:hypothetical protein
MEHMEHVVELRLEVLRGVVGFCLVECNGAHVLGQDRDRTPMRMPTTTSRKRGLVCCDSSSTPPGMICAGEEVMIRTRLSAEDTLVFGLTNWEDGSHVKADLLIDGQPRFGGEGWANDFDAWQKLRYTPGTQKMSERELVVDLGICIPS